MAFRYSRYHYHKGEKGRCECPVGAPEHQNRANELLTELHQANTELSRLDIEYNRIRRRHKKILRRAARFLPIRGKLQLSLN